MAAQKGVTPPHIIRRQQGYALTTAMCPLGHHNLEDLRDYRRPFEAHLLKMADAKVAHIQGLKRSTVGELWSLLHENGGTLPKCYLVCHDLFAKVTEVEILGVAPNLQKPSGDSSAARKQGVRAIFVRTAHGEMLVNSTTVVIEG